MKKTLWSLKQFGVDKTDEQVFSSLTKAIELAPRNPMLMTELGSANLALWNETGGETSDEQRKKYFSEAEKQFLKAVELKEDYIPPRMNLGVAYYQMQEFAKAKEQFDAIISFNPDYSDALYFSGLINDRMGDKDGAIVLFERIERLNPNAKYVKDILANLRAGKSALEGFGNEVPEQGSERSGD